MSKTVFHDPSGRFRGTAAKFGLAVFLFGLAAVPVAPAQSQTTELISVDSAGNQADARSSQPSINADGRFVGFSSSARNLVPDGDPLNGNTDVFIHDRLSGETELISADSFGAQGNNSSFDSSISADGRFVAFSSAASNLVAIDGNGSTRDIFLRDRDSGTTELISLSPSGGPSFGSSLNPLISADGGTVVFQSWATNLLPGADLNGSDEDIFLFDRDSGATELVSVNSAGVQANDRNFAPVVSPDGSLVVFYSLATNLTQGTDTNGSLTDVFLRDRNSGTTELISVNSLGEQGDNSSNNASVSADGRFVAFTSRATNLVLGSDANGAFSNVFLRDRATGTTELLSVNEAGEPGNGTSVVPSISADGRFVAYLSTASNLVPGGDANGTQGDIFVHDRTKGTTERISVATSGEQANGRNTTFFGRIISADGRFVAFGSSATNLIPGADANGGQDDIFVRDRGVTNQPPIANAGEDGTFECRDSAGTRVALDGGGSSDLDGDELTYLWTGPFPEGGGTVSGVSPTVTLALGGATIALVVDDGQLDSEPDTVTNIVQDTTAPNLVASLSPVRWRRFRIGFAGSDGCDPAPTVTAVLVVPGIPDIPVNDGQIIRFKVDDEVEKKFRRGILRIEGPSLTLRVTATDANGNTAVAEVEPGGSGAS